MDIMSKFTENVSAYMSAKKIKNNYISLKTGFDTSKLSRVLNDKQPATEDEMTLISNALGHDCAYFLQDDFSAPTDQLRSGKVALCYIGNPTESQKVTFNKLVELAENMENIVSAKANFYEAIGVTHYESN